LDINLPKITVLVLYYYSSSSTISLCHDISTLLDDPPVFCQEQNTTYSGGGLRSYGKNLGHFLELIMTTKNLKTNNIYWKMLFKFLREMKKRFLNYENLR